MTEKIFLLDAYRSELQTQIVSVGTEPHPYIEVRETIFYALGGGQPGDIGEIRDANGSSVQIVDTRYDKHDRSRILHFLAPDAALPDWHPDQGVTLSIDWPRRHRLMRMHTAMHLLCALIPAPVTGGGCGETESRVEFDIETNDFDKATLSAQLNQFVLQGLDVHRSEITDNELDANPELVRTMSVQPPRGAGTIRMIKIGDGIDYQPCGGTHVKNTAEIGELVITKIKSKGKQNKRVNIALVNP